MGASSVMTKDELERMAKIYVIVDGHNQAGRHYGLPQSMIDAEIKKVIDEEINGVPRPPMPNLKNARWKEHAIVFDINEKYK